MGYIEKYYLDDFNRNQEESIDINTMDGIDELREVDSLEGGGGGGQSNKVLTPEEDKDISTTLGNNLETTDEYTINITTGLSPRRSLGRKRMGATVYLNDVPLPDLTPKNYKVKLSELFKKGRQVIEVKKNGYSSNQKYILEVSPAGDETIDEISLLEDPNIQKVLGINKLNLKIRYFEDGVEKKFMSQPKGNFINIPFTLERNPKIQEPNNLNKINITLKGPDSSVEILSDTETDLLDSGEESFEEKKGSKILLKSSNNTLYRISEIIVSDESGESERLTAGSSESIRLELVLNRDLDVTILSHRVVKKKILKPLIRLKSASTKKYNINDKIDIPLIVEKNDDVRAISMIIGSEILEFDNLKKGKFAGIKIPHRLIEAIGKYKIKLFPYSISELQKGQKDDNVKELPSPPKPISNPNIVKETPVFTDTKEETDKSVPPVVKDKFLSKTPTNIRGGGGGNRDDIGGRS